MKDFLCQIRLCDFLENRKVTGELHEVQEGVTLILSE